MTAISGSALIHLPTARATGTPDEKEVIRVSVILQPKTAMPQAQSRARLSREVFAAVHGADASAIASVENFAKQNGLAVIESQADRRTVVLSGNLAAMARAFGVKFAVYETDTVQYRGYEGAITVPQDLAHHVVAVLGLDNRPAAQPRFRVAASPTLGSHVAGGPYSPVEVAAAYVFPSTNQGSGQCIGIIELGGGYLATDLQSFFGGLSLPVPQIVSVSVDGGTNSPGGSDDFEVGLDIEVAGAVAPQARLAVYFAPNTFQGFLDAITTAVHDSVNQPSVISISWGLSEDSWSQTTLTAFDQAFQAAGVLAVTVFVAAGDNGSSDGVADGLAHVDFPASSPNVVGCGGTTLVANGATIQTEVVWNGNGATGGGVSDQFALPPWQVSAGVPVSANPSHNPGRGVPDVSGDADPQTGYSCFVQGQPVTIGGTSAVAPLWAGLTALINGALGHSIGFINPTIYSHGYLFRDIVSGNNGAYSANPGWDACTGWGSPNGRTLVSFLVGGQLWHTIRNADGTWQVFFGLIESQEQNIPGAFTAISCAGAGDQLQVVGVVGGQLWHTIRNADGSWQSFFGLIESQEQNNPGAFTAISCAGVGDQLHAVGVVAGELWHTIRNADGSWQNFFGLIESQEQNNPGTFTAISCAGVGDQLHVVGVVGGQLWHTIRNADGSWQNFFGLIESQEQNNPGAFTAISCSGAGDQLQIVGVVAGELWHTIRNADGSWQNFFGLIESQEQNNPGTFTAISCGGVGTQLQVVGVVGGQLWHTIRNADGTWQDFFGLIESQEQNDPGAFTSIGCAGVGNQLQTVGVV